MARRRFYSPSTGGFYSQSIHGSAVPEDAVAVTEPHYQRLMKAQTEGQTIVFRSGKVTTIDPADDIETRTASNRRKRNALLQGSDWTQLADAPLLPAKRAAWAAYRQSLRDIDLASKLEPVGWPQAPSGAD